MHQVLFRIPVPGIEGGVPLYGYGLMLCLACLFCSWLAGRLAEREGMARERILDLAFLLFVFGLVGARVTFLLFGLDAAHRPATVGEFLAQLPRIWDGGIIFYGSVIGGLVGYAVAYVFILRKHGIGTARVADIVAPTAAVGLCLGRVGCLLNGCCWGAVAPAGLPGALHFPLCAPPRYALVADGSQTAAGFTLRADDPGTVAAVEPGSDAARKGLTAGDRIASADGQQDWDNYLADPGRMRGRETVRLRVRRGREEHELPALGHRTLGLYPTQVYESVSMALVFLLLMAYYPFRRRPGELMALLMVCYGLHRALNERLRADFRPEGFEEYTSWVLVGAGVVLWLWLRFRGGRAGDPGAGVPVALPSGR